MSNNFLYLVIILWPLLYLAIGGLVFGITHWLWKCIEPPSVIDFIIALLLWPIVLLVIVFYIKPWEAE